MTLDVTEASMSVSVILQVFKQTDNAFSLPHNQVLMVHCGSLLLVSSVNLPD